MVLDTSALVAMLLGEPERDRFITALADAEEATVTGRPLLFTGEDFSQTDVGAATA